MSWNCSAPLHFSSAAGCWCRFWCWLKTTAKNNMCNGVLTCSQTVSRVWHVSPPNHQGSIVIKNGEANLRPRTEWTIPIQAKAIQTRLYSIIRFVWHVEAETAIERDTQGRREGAKVREWEFPEPPLASTSAPWRRRELAYWRHKEDKALWTIRILSGPSVQTFSVERVWAKGSKERKKELKVQRGKKRNRERGT